MFAGRRLRATDSRAEALKALTVKIEQLDQKVDQVVERPVRVETKVSQ